MKILITGSNGFIGQHLFKFLSKDEKITHLYGIGRSYNTYPFKHLNTDKIIEKFYCDLTDENQVKNLIDVCQPDIIYHLAAKATVKTSKEEEIELIKQNILSTQNLLTHSKKDTRFVFTSSILVDKECRDMNRNLVYDTNSLYGASKASSELLIKNYCDLNKISSCILRLCAVVGPNLTHGVLKDFIARIKEPTEEFVIWGDAPGSYKPYLYINDVINSLLYFGNQDNLKNMNKNFLITNICPINSINTKRIAEILMEETNIFKKIRFLGESANFTGDTREIVSSNSKSTILGFNYKFKTSEEAIRQAIKDNI